LSSIGTDSSIFGEFLYATLSIVASSACAETPSSPQAA
jgi:hypothetical protein